MSRYLERKDGNLSILVFRHPLAGYQLVKGTLEPHELADAAVFRNLSEESGIESANVICHLGIWRSNFQDQIWAFYLCEAKGLAD